MEATKEPTISTRKLYLIFWYDEECSKFSDNSTELVELDHYKYETPLELIKAFIYNKHKYEVIKIETIWDDLTKITAIKWIKRFKSKYCSIEKFFQKHNDSFELLNDNKNVKLHIYGVINKVAGNQCSQGSQWYNCSSFDEDVDTNIGDEERDKKDKYRWFDFVDSKITSISSRLENHTKAKSQLVCCSIVVNQAS